MITREEYEKDLENVLKPVDEQRMSKDEYDKRYATLEFGMIENYITHRNLWICLINYWQCIRSRERTCTNVIIQENLFRGLL